MALKLGKFLLQMCTHQALEEYRLSVLSIHHLTLGGVSVHF